MPETNAQPTNCPLLFIYTPTVVPPETVVGEKFIHEPTEANALPLKTPVVGLTLKPAPLGARFIHPIPSPQICPVIPVSVIVTAVAPGVLAFSVGFQFTNPYKLHAVSRHTFVILFVASIVPTVSEAYAKELHTKNMLNTIALSRTKKTFSNVREIIMQVYHP
jgi:hypothetical protein